ncbi:NAD(P)H:quinone oxidoreductase (plasmid) [Sinorhizobium meliloti]|nr:NAD(P)H:quinone oxidoreductase [Sinorhizobium meliloti]
MAKAVAEGAAQAAPPVALKRVPELVPEAVARRSGYGSTRTPLLRPSPELADSDAIIIGTPTRYGNHGEPDEELSRPDRRPLGEDKLVVKWAASSPRRAAARRQESTNLSTHIVMLHLGMVIVRLAVQLQGQMRMDAITGGSPYGASTLAEDENHGDRSPSANELDGARFQGRHVAEIAAAHHAGSQTAPAGAGPLNMPPFAAVGSAWPRIVLVVGAGVVSAFQVGKARWRLRLCRRTGTQLATDRGSSRSSLLLAP